MRQVRSKRLAPLFEKNPNPPRQGQKKLVVFRPRHDQREYLDQQKANKNRGPTEVLIGMMDIAMGIERVLGDRLAVYKGLAEMAGLSLGEVLARAAESGLPALRSQVDKQITDKIKK